MTPTAFDLLVDDDEPRMLPPREMTTEELFAFHWQARTIAFRAREFFADASMSCSRAPQPVGKVRTLAELMQVGAQ